MVTTSPASNKVLFLWINLTGVLEREGEKIVLILVAPAFTLLNDRHTGIRQVLQNNCSEMEALDKGRPQTSRAKISSAVNDIEIVPSRNSASMPSMRTSAGSGAAIFSNEKAGADAKQNTVIVLEGRAVSNQSRSGIRQVRRFRRAMQRHSTRRDLLPWFGPFPKDVSDAPVNSYRGKYVDVTR